MATDIIRLRYAGTCSVCGSALAASTKARWDRVAKLITCLECGGAAASGPPTETLPDPPALATPESGLAGASAQKEY